MIGVHKHDKGERGKCSPVRYAQRGLPKHLIITLLQQQQPLKNLTLIRMFEIITMHLTLMILTMIRAVNCE